MSDKNKPLGPLHGDSVKRNDYSKTPKPAPGFSDNTPGTTRKPVLHKPEQEKK